LWKPLNNLIWGLEVPLYKQKVGKVVMPLFRLLKCANAFKKRIAPCGANGWGDYPQCCFGRAKVVIIFTALKIILKNTHFLSREKIIKTLIYSRC